MHPGQLLKKPSLEATEHKMVRPKSRPALHTIFQQGEARVRPTYQQLESAVHELQRREKAQAKAIDELSSENERFEARFEEQARRIAECERRFEEMERSMKKYGITSSDTLIAGTSISVELPSIQDQEDMGFLGARCAG